MTWSHLPPVTARAPARAPSLARASLLLLGLGLAACGPDLHSFGFQPARRAALSPATAEDAAVADFDGDGRADLVTAERDHLTLRLGTADGSFVPGRPISVPGLETAAGVAAGDVDGDGRPDLVVLLTARVQTILDVTGAATDRKDTLLGTFAAASLALGDVNGDGRADLALATAADGNGKFSARVLKAGDGGGFSMAEWTTIYQDIAGAPRLALADVNKDGRRDLLWPAVGRVGALLGGGNGTFDTKNGFPIDTGPVTAVAAYDLNRDGDADVIGAAADGSLKVALSKGDGTFRAALPYPVGFPPSWVAAGDVDGDGRPDLVAVQPAQVAVRRGAGL